MKYLPILLLLMMGCDTKPQPTKTIVIHDTVIIPCGTHDYSGSTLVSYDSCKTWHTDTPNNH